MVLEVGPDTRQVGYYGDISLLQKAGRPDTAQLEDLRRVNGACSENDFFVSRHCAPLPAAVGWHILHPGSRSAVEQNLVDFGGRDEVVVWTIDTVPMAGTRI